MEFKEMLITMKHSIEVLLDEMHDEPCPEGPAIPLHFRSQLASLYHTVCRPTSSSSSSCLETSGGSPNPLTWSTKPDSATTTSLSTSSSNNTDEKHLLPVSASPWTRFYQKSLPQRQALLSQLMPSIKLSTLGTLPLPLADLMIENCIGVFGLPLGLGLHFKINGRAYAIPMVTEEPSVVAAASKGAKLIGQGDGFITSVTRSIMTGQVTQPSVPSLSRAIAAIHEAKRALVTFANTTLCPRMVIRGGGVRDVYCRVVQVASEAFVHGPRLPSQSQSQSQDQNPPHEVTPTTKTTTRRVVSSSSFTSHDLGTKRPCPSSSSFSSPSTCPLLVVHVEIDVCDAMGANVVNTVMEGLEARLAALSGASKGVAILTNLSLARRTRVSFALPVSLLEEAARRPSALDRNHSSTDINPSSHHSLTCFTSPRSPQEMTSQPCLPSLKDPSRCHPLTRCVTTSSTPNTLKGTETSSLSSNATCSALDSHLPSEPTSLVHSSNNHPSSHPHHRLSSAPAHAHAHADAPADAHNTMSRGERLARAIVAASHFGTACPYRAVTHNKGICNGMDAAAMATGQDVRAIEAAAHGFAARSGTVTALSTYSLSGTPPSDQETEGKDKGTVGFPTPAKALTLHGMLELPLAVGIVGGITASHPAVVTNLALLGSPSVADLSGILVATGLASNFAALLALAQEGIQHGHMKLHARNSVARRVASTGDTDKAGGVDPTSWTGEAVCDARERG